MATPILDVYLPDGTQQSYELTDTRVVVGTAPKCQVVIDQPEFVAEHLLISPRSDGCGIIVARGVATPTLVDGQPFERGLVPYEATITIGQVKLVPRDGKRVRRAGCTGSAFCKLKFCHFHIPVCKVCPEEVVDLLTSLSVLEVLELTFHITDEGLQTSPDPRVG